MLLQWLKNRFLYGRPIYVWKNSVWDPAGRVLAFTENWRGTPIFSGDKSWEAFEPKTFPLEYSARHVSKWCRVFVPDMLTEVRKNGYFIAPPFFPVVSRYTTFQLFEQQTRSFFVFRYAYMWSDNKSLEILPTVLDGRPIEQPWKFEKSFDISFRLERAKANFWEIHDALETQGFAIEPMDKLPAEVLDPAHPAFDFRAVLLSRLRALIFKNDYAIPPDDISILILDVGKAIWVSRPQQPDVLQQPRPEEEESRAEWDAFQSSWSKDSDLIFEAIVACLSAFMRALPRFHSAPFTRPFSASTNVTGGLIAKMMEPFWQPALQDRGLCEGLVQQYSRNTADFTFNRTGTSKPLETMWPWRYQGPTDRLAEVYLRHTPLRPLFDVHVPYQPFSEINRCAHHWCLGKTRRGKTTFLRHLIKHDLEEVAKGNCSLVVIDSKTLIGEMRTLRQFAPGGPLDGKLILLDSDHLFPLNPFHLPKEQARAVLTYMLANLSDASQLQSGALGFYIDAVLQSQNKSFQTILDYMRLKATPKNVELPREIDRFDKGTADWFRSTRASLHSSTSGGIEQRLTNFMREHQDAPVLKMLTADSWGNGKLDLYEQLDAGGKVVLVDTDWHANGAEGANLLGRLFIALIEQLATRRMKNPGKPIWVYVDEASDYLNNDAKFVQILIKAAAAKVGMTVAYQYKGLIDLRIEKALENAEIHSHCTERGRVELSIEERPLVLPMAQLEFDREPQMHRHEYAALRAALAEKFPYRTVGTKKPNGFDPNLEAE